VNFDRGESMSHEAGHHDATGNKEKGAADRQVTSCPEITSAQHEIISFSLRGLRLWNGTRRGFAAPNGFAVDAT
jgi:hypothetical protein